jgi:putative nucleotidyltransferase with HDIG domain
MGKLANLEADVKALYDAKDPNRGEWADWLAVHHVFVVADFASELAVRYGADESLARAAALLHDIADAKMSRFDPAHEETSLTMARELLAKNGYSDEEITLLIDDAIRLHSCHDGKVPTSLEGKILSTADSLAHLKTDFYLYAVYARSTEESLEDVKTWALKKLERDFHAKIQFDDVEKDTRSDYEMLKNLFSR